MGYKKQSADVLQGNDRCLFRDPPHKYTLGQNVEFMNVRL